MTFGELLALLRADIARLIVTREESLKIGLKWLFLIHPRFMPVLIVRLARYFFLCNWLRFLSPFFTWVNVVIFGLEFTPRCEVGPGLMIPHSVGTVIGAKKIGANATIFQGVTLGADTLDLEFSESKRPELGHNVMVGAGAKVLGGVYVGNGVKIGANAVVIKSIPDNSVAVGVPARILGGAGESLLG